MDRLKIQKRWRMLLFVIFLVVAFVAVIAFFSGQNRFRQLKTVPQGIPLPANLAAAEDDTVSLHPYATISAVADRVGPTVVGIATRQRAYDWFYGSVEQGGRFRHYFDLPDG